MENWVFDNILIVFAIAVGLFQCVCAAPGFIVGIIFVGVREGFNSGVNFWPGARKLWKTEQS
jgi:hypothetical protein